MSDILQLTFYVKTQKITHTTECIVTLEADVLAAFPPEVPVRSSWPKPWRPPMRRPPRPGGARRRPHRDPVRGGPAGADPLGGVGLRLGVRPHRSERADPAVYVLTNTRSLDPAEAASRNEEVVRNALARREPRRTAPVAVFGWGSSAAATPRSAATTRSSLTSSPPPWPRSAGRRPTVWCSSRPSPTPDGSPLEGSTTCAVPGVGGAPDPGGARPNSPRTPPSASRAPSWPTTWRRSRGAASPPTP